MKSDWKTIVSAVLCPVVLACGAPGEDESPARLYRSLSPDTGYVLPGPAFPVSVPDSVSSTVLWLESHPLLITEVSAVQVEVAPGDTFLLGSDPYLSIERERMTMELELAVATGDSLVEDSLRGALADSSRFIAVTAPGEGRAHVPVTAGMTLQPGDTVAVVTGPPPDSLFMVHRIPGQTGWPAGTAGEVSSRGDLFLEGIFTSDSVSLPGFYLVEQSYIHEEGLSTFLLGTAGDTLHVTVAGTHNGLRLVYSAVPLDSLPLSDWD